MAATKYIVGHSDVMMGLITTTEEQWDKVRPSAAVLGANSGPDDVYLALRGLRTLPVRLQRHMETGITLAKWLQERPEVEQVFTRPCRRIPDTRYGNVISPAPAGCSPSC